MDYGTFVVIGALLSHYQPIIAPLRFAPLDDCQASPGPNARLRHFIHY